MRFAVALLSLLAIASIIGTVLKQGEPYSNYLAQFGPFWFPIFEQLGFYDVYHSFWFLGILGFLVFSTSLCLYRHTPTFLREARSFREKIQENSLRAISSSLALHTQLPADLRQKTLQPLLDRAGYRSRISLRQDDILIAAKSGSFQRWGYVLTHAGIVVICLGGLLDGNLPFLWQKAWGTLQPETRDIPASQVPATARLPTSNLSFRGNVSIPEGSKTDFIFLNVADGYLLQELPFTIGVDRFHIEHYPTGQPKSFITNLTVQDKKTGETAAAEIAVNHPFSFAGVNIYQASFGDGGSKLTLRSWDLSKNAAEKPAPRLINGEVHQSQTITLQNHEYTLEWVDFRPFNVENTGTKEALAAKTRVGGAAVNMQANKTMVNVGPSFIYRLRDDQGQAKEFQNYMQPIALEGRFYYVSGVRNNPNEPYRYLRIPQAPAILVPTMDTSVTPSATPSALAPYFAWRAFLLNPLNHRKIAEQFSMEASKNSHLSIESRLKLAESSQQVLRLFTEKGLEGVAQFLEAKVPTNEREMVAQAYLKILDGTAFTALQLSQTQLGQPIKIPEDQATQAFVHDALTSLSDSFYYEAPLWLELTDFQLIQATGLQLTRSPGKFWVYLGSLLLVGGIFIMLYIREKRLWILLKPQETIFAMATHRKNLESAQEQQKWHQYMHQMHEPHPLESSVNPPTT